MFDTRAWIVCFVRQLEVWASSAGTAPDAVFRSPLGFFFFFSIGGAAHMDIRLVAAPPCKNTSLLRHF